MNREMLQGQCDGKYKRILPDRTNVQSPDHYQAERQRRDEISWPYGLYQSYEFETPDGRWVVPD
jgi:hypothetical protein